MRNYNQRPISENEGCGIITGLFLLCWGAYLVFGVISAGTCLMITGAMLIVTALL